MAAFPLRAIKDTGKTINITNHFNEDGGGIYALDAIELGNGTLWDDAMIKQIAMQSTAIQKQ